MLNVSQTQNKPCLVLSYMLIQAHTEHLKDCLHYYMYFQLPVGPVVSTLKWNYLMVENSVNTDHQKTAK